MTIQNLFQPNSLHKPHGLNSHAQGPDQADKKHIHVGPAVDQPVSLSQSHKKHIHVGLAANLPVSLAGSLKGNCVGPNPGKAASLTSSQADLARRLAEQQRS